MQGIHLGGLITSVAEDYGTPVILTEAARTLPLYLIGKPNMGKSTVLLHAMHHDIHAGHGFVFIEPDTNLFYRILALIPDERRDDVIAINYGDHAFPIGNNPVDGYHTDDYRDERPKVVESLMATTHQLWADNISTARMPLVFRHTYYTLIENKYTSFMSAHRLYTDPDYRDQLRANVQNPHTRDYWDDFERKRPKQRDEMSEPITNRLRQLYANPTISNIICQPCNTIDYAAHIRAGGILVVNLNRTANDDAVGLLGSLLFSRLYQTARHLGTLTRPFTFYLDDFTEYALPVFPETFSQARHLRFALAHQHAGQLDDYPTLQKAVRGSAGTIVAFQVGDTDARDLDRELGINRDIDRDTPRLTHLPRFTAAAKLQQPRYQDPDTSRRPYDNDEYVVVATDPPPAQDYGNIETIIERSRSYAEPRADVEEYIRQWYSSRYARGDEIIEDGSIEFG